MLYEKKGMTYEEIAELFGVSRQAVHSAINRSNDGFRAASVRKVKYVGLRDWLMENRINVGELEKRIGGNRLHQAIKGKGNPQKSTIDAILAVTGLTYEECFKEEDAI